MKRKLLNLAGVATLVFLTAAVGSLNLPASIAATPVLNAICGAALKTEVHHGKIHSQE